MFSLASRLWRFVAIILFLALAGPALFAQENSDEESVSDLWIDILIGRPIVPLFNPVSRASDMAHVDRPEQMGQLEGITLAQKMLIFKSAQEAEARLPQLAKQIDLLGYNLEHGPGTPAEEQADPVAAIKKMRALADEHGLALALGPDHDFALSHGVAMAPYVDYFVLQIQRRQTEPAVVHEFVSALVPQLRTANGALQISVQVRTEGDMAALVQLLQSLLPYIDGVSILTSPETVDTAEQLLHKLRGHNAYLPLLTWESD